MRYFAVLTLGLLLSAACVDVEGGDRASYGNPCGSDFRGLLLCDRETGGADPRPPDGTEEQPATCETACEKLNGCFGTDPNCLTACADPSVTQELLDCIVNTVGCDFNLCINGGA